MSALCSCYFHVPFCDQLCWYCGCTSKAANHYKPISKYARTISAEIESISALLDGRPRVKHLHWGGGTPTVLRRSDFCALMYLVRSSFDVSDDAEIAIEGDPRSLTREKAYLLAAVGINRVSLGVQDFTPAVQQAINRVQPFEVVASAVRYLREAGINNINFDLMYGLPYQTVADVVKSVELAIRLGPNRLSVFGYAHVPWAKTHQKLINERSLPDPHARMEQAEATTKCLTQNGYHRIGLDHFARLNDPLAKALDDGSLRRNFQGYTTDKAPTLLGFGVSAISCLPQGFAQNTTSTYQYATAISGNRLATSKGIALTPSDVMRWEIIERLMCTGEVNLKQVAADHGCSREQFGFERIALQGMENDGLVRVEGNSVCVTAIGWPFVRTISAVFDLYLRNGRGRHCPAI